MTVEPSQSQRCASTEDAPSVSSSVSVPKPISGVSRRRRMRRSNQFSSEAGSRRSAVALTCAGPNAPSVTGRRSRRLLGRVRSKRGTSGSAQRHMHQPSFVPFAAGRASVMHLRADVGKV